MLLLVLLAMKIGYGLSSSAANETDGITSRKILGSSVVTSVSVIVDIGNGSKTYFADAAGKPLPRPATATQLASPIILLNPDRYEFYTFNDNGNLIKRLMTLEEIQGIIASGDGEALNYNSHLTLDENPEKHVDDVVSNVQNVLKEEIEAHKNSTFNLSMLDTPNTSLNWDLILPTIFGNSVENITPQEVGKTEAEVAAVEQITIIPPKNVSAIPDTVILPHKTPLLNETAFEIKTEIAPIVNNGTSDNITLIGFTEINQNNMTVTPDSVLNLSSTDSSILSTKPTTYKPETTILILSKETTVDSLTFSDSTQAPTTSPDVGKPPSSAQASIKTATEVTPTNNSYTRITTTDLITPPSNTQPPMSTENPVVLTGSTHIPTTTSGRLATFLIVEGIKQNQSTTEYPSTAELELVKYSTQENTKVQNNTRNFTIYDLVTATTPVTNNQIYVETVTVYNTPPFVTEKSNMLFSTPVTNSSSTETTETTSTSTSDAINIPEEVTTTMNALPSIVLGTNLSQITSQLLEDSTSVSETAVNTSQAIHNQTILQTSTLSSNAFATSGFTTDKPFQTTLLLTAVDAQITSDSNNSTELKNRYEETDLNQVVSRTTTEKLQKPNITTVQTFPIDIQTTTSSEQIISILTNANTESHLPTTTQILQDLITTKSSKIDSRLENDDVEHTNNTEIKLHKTTTGYENELTSTTEDIETTTLKVTFKTDNSMTTKISTSTPKIETTKHMETSDPATKSTPEFINISATTTKPKTIKPTEQKVISHSQSPSTPKPDMTWTLVPTIVPPKLTSVNNDSKQSTTAQPVDLVPKPLQGFGLEDSTSTLDTDIYQFVDLCNELAFSFWSSVTSNISFARSVVVSPFAATSMLAMVFLGARGSTSGEMNEILKLDDMVTFNPHAMFKDVTDSIEVSKKSGVAASVFIKELYSDKSKGKLLRFYKDRVKQFYDGHVEEADFNEISDVIRRRTNLLVKRHTWGKILEFFKDSNIVAQPPLAAVSANIFQSDCSEASVEGRDGEIHFVVLPSIRQRKLIPIPAAVWRTGFLAGYDPALDATAVSIGTKEQTISIIFVIPGQQGISAPGDGLIRLETRLITHAFRQGAWSRLLRSLIPRPGLEVQIPRFSHKSVINATAALRQMGLKDLFNASTADLKGLNGIPNELYLSDMIQINTFATCGEGRIEENHHSEIYPATANRPLRKIRKLHTFEDANELNVLRDPLYDTGYLTLPLQLRPRQARLPEIPRLRFDRPFLYFVRHNPTGLILHIGRFNPRLLP